MPDYFDTGFCVRRPSWHKKERLLADYPESWEEARRLAGLEWEPEERPLAVKVAERPNGEPIWEEINGQKAIVRSDTKAHLGTVGKGWTPISHALMGEMVEALCEQPNVKIETMISVKGGRQVAATILLDEPYELPGDEGGLSLPYLALLNRHDGSGACKGLGTDVRVVCANTYDAASMQGERTGRQFSFHHTSGVLDRIEEAKATIAGLRSNSQAWRALADELIAIPAPAEAVSAFVADFIPEPPADVISERVRSNIGEARATFRSLLEASPTIGSSGGTALGLVHASVEYLDHLRGWRNRDSYIGRQLLRPEPMKAKAVRLARAACGA